MGGGGGGRRGRGKGKGEREREGEGERRKGGLESNSLEANYKISVYYAE